jgi:integrase
MAETENMPKKAKELKPIEVARLTASGFHAVGGVAGLHLRVSDSGARSWIARLLVGRKRRDIGLGGYPDVPLSQARERTREAREKIRNGIDPVEARRAALTSLRGTLTFDQAAERLISAKSPEWKNAKHAAQWVATLKTYASPTVGNMPVDQIELSHVVDILTPIWREKTETATRLRSRIEAVLSWATASGYRSGENPARWRGNLDAGILPRAGKIRKVVHHAAVPIDDVPGFMAQLRQREGVAARALEFLILTATRSGEVRGAQWSEIDLEAATWTIPAERMKAGKAHSVPLTAPALAILREIPRVAGSDIVFWGASGGPLSDMTLSAIMRRMKVDAVPHGFRSSFRDWASERTNYPSQVAEMALAHTVGNKVEAAYRRGDLFGKRVDLMRDWAKFCASP